MSQRRSIADRIHGYLAEPPGQQFTRNKYRFWLPIVVGFSILNPLLTVIVFSDSAGLAGWLTSILLAVGGLACWLNVGALHYSDSSDRKLAVVVSLLDSIALIFCIAHFSFLVWTLGHFKTLQSAEAKYEAQTIDFNARAERIRAQDVKIAESGATIATEERKRARLENDTAFQLRRAAESGAKISASKPKAAGSVATSLPNSSIELERPLKPEQSAAAFLTRWDSLIRIANFGELLLGVLTLIWIRNRSARTNEPIDHTSIEPELGHVLARSAASAPALDSTAAGHTAKSGSRRLPPAAAIAAERAAALDKLRDHLKVIGSYAPGFWLRADLLPGGGVLIRMSHRVNGFEEQVGSTRQSDKLLMAVDRPDFRDRLFDELIHQNFPLSKPS